MAMLRFWRKKAYLSPTPGRDVMGVVSVRMAIGCYNTLMAVIAISEKTRAVDYESLDQRMQLKFHLGGDWQKNVAELSGLQRIPLDEISGQSVDPWHKLRENALPVVRYFVRKAGLDMHNPHVVAVCGYGMCDYMNDAEIRLTWRLGRVDSGVYDPEWKRETHRQSLNERLERVQNFGGVLTQRMGVYVEETGLVPRAQVLQRLPFANTAVLDKVVRQIEPDKDWAGLTTTVLNLQPAKLYRRGGAPEERWGIW